MDENKTWREKLKELTTPEGKEEYAKHRKEVVDKILNDVIKSKCETCSQVSSGSTTATSDYDINISGPKADEVVAEFNRRFEEEYKMTSAEKFDTNVYGFPRVYESSEHKHDSHERYIEQFKEDATNKNFEYIKNPKTQFYQDLNTYNQHVWALRKLYEALKENEKRAVRKKPYFFALAESRPLSIKENNVKYESFLHRLATTVMEFEKGGDVKDEEIDYLIVRYNDLVSHGNYHAQETYYSTGPYMDVVVNQQMKLGIPLSEDQYMDSYIENMAFAFDHLTCDEDEKAKLDASKYLKRASDAFLKISRLTTHIEDVDEAQIKSLDDLRSTLKASSQSHTSSKKLQCPTRSKLFETCMKRLDEFFACVEQPGEEKTKDTIKTIVQNIPVTTIDHTNRPRLKCMKHFRTGDDTLTFIGKDINVPMLIQELKMKETYPVTYEIKGNILAIMFEYKNFPFKIKIISNPKDIKQFEMNDTSMDLSLF
jgi:hypothetical protein